MFKVFKGSDDQYYFGYYAKNGQQILKSEGYTSKQNAEKGIQSVIENISNYEILRTKRGRRYYYNIFAKNGEIVATSCKSFTYRHNAKTSITKLINLIPCLTIS